MKSGKWIVLAMLAAVFHTRAIGELLPEPEAEKTAPAANRFGFDRGAFDAEQPMVITADRIEFDNKVKVAVFDGQVKVAHPQFYLEADQVFVFIDDANELKNILAQGGVVITNESSRAVCEWALYTRAEDTLMMRAGGEEGGVAQLTRGADFTVGYQITFWLAEERMEVAKDPNSTTQTTFVISPETLRPGGVKKETPEEKKPGPEENMDEPDKPAPAKPALYKNPEADKE